MNKTIETLRRRLRSASKCLAFIIGMIVAFWFASALFAIAMYMVTLFAQLGLMLLGIALVALPIAIMCGAFDSDEKPNKKGK